MSQAGAPEPDPSMIGRVAKPPFARLPDPLQVFVQRTQRFRALASTHQLEPYLRFLGDLSEAQYRTQDGLPEPDMPDADVIARAIQHKMPRLDRSRFTADAALEATFDRLLPLAGTLDMPATARAALERVQRADPAARETMVRDILGDAIPIETMAEQVFVSAVLQVHFARMAARLDAKTMDSVGDGVCPSCGGPPVCSVIVRLPEIEGARYCCCALCSTQWNYIRVKCTVCASTKDVTYQEVADGPGTVKAEVCGNCRSYVKVLHQQKDPALDPFADDVASLGLDILVRDLGYSRGGVNPFLLGY